MKTYLVSEELLRQVLGCIGYAIDAARSASAFALVTDTAKAVETLLAKEPNEPVAWSHFQNKHAFVPHEGEGSKVGMEYWKNPIADEYDIPLYRKDTP